jgi:4-amino-4-deoxy-L-arabinose transferase-like glycosyltransferase
MADRSRDATERSPSPRAEERRRLISFGGHLRSISAFDMLLWLFIVAGIVARLSRLDAMEFKHDEFTHVLSGYRAFVHPWSTPLLGEQGVNVSPGVFFYQFLSVPVAVTRDPVWIARFIALVNVASIFALFRLVRGVFTSQVALWTTALFATTPWMIVFSRKIWNPDLIVPFLLLTLWCLFSAMQRYAQWKVIAFAVSLALVSQLHLSVWLALFPLLPLGLVFRPWRKPIDLALGVTTFLAVYVLTLGSTADAFIARLFEGPTTRSDLGMDLPQLFGYNALWSIRVPSGFGFGFLLGSDGHASFAQYPVATLARPVFAVYVVLAGAGVAYALYRLIRATRGSFVEVADRFLLTLLLMACAVHALYLVLHVAAHPHYHVVLSLLPPLLVAMFLVGIADRPGRTARVLAKAVLVLVLVANVAFAFSFLAFVRANPTTIEGEYGRPYFLDRGDWERELGEGFLRIDRLGER